MASKRIFRACKLQGLSLHADALARLTQELTNEPSLALDDVLYAIKNSIDKSKMTTSVVTLEALESALDTLLAVSSENQFEAIQVFNAFETPKLHFSPHTNSYELKADSHRRIHAGPEDRLNLLRDRFISVDLRVKRNKMFSPPAVSVSNTVEYIELSRIESLLGVTGVKRVIGMLGQDERKRIYLEDLTSRIYVDLTNATYTNGLFTINCIVLVEGEVIDDVLHVHSMGFPPPEPKAQSLNILSGIDPLGVEVSAQQLEQIRELEASDHHATFIVLSDVHLDDPQVMKHLDILFQGLESVLPSLFVLMGDFISSSIGGGAGSNSLQDLKEYFDELANLILKHPRLAEFSKFVLVPGPNDPGSSRAFPRHPLPSMCTQELMRRVPNVTCTTNPCRIRYYTQDLVIFRDNLHQKMQRHALLPVISDDNDGDEAEPIDADNEDGERGGASSQVDISKHLVKTIIDQAHLTPLPLMACPINWAFDSSLQLFPLPDVLILGDSTEQFQLGYSSVAVFHPGPFHVDFSFVLYRPSTNTTEFSRVEKLARRIPEHWRQAVVMGDSSAGTRNFVSQWKTTQQEIRDCSAQVQDPGIQWRSVQRVANKQKQQSVGCDDEYDVGSIYANEAAPQWLSWTCATDRRKYGNTVSLTADKLEDLGEPEPPGNGYSSDPSTTTAKSFEARTRPQSASASRPQVHRYTSAAAGQFEFVAAKSRTRPQSAKPQRAHEPEPNRDKSMLLEQIKDSKWTEMMFRSLDFQQHNLLRLEQETYELLQSVFRKERAVQASKLNQQSGNTGDSGSKKKKKQGTTKQTSTRNSVAHKSTKASEAKKRQANCISNGVLCGSGMQLARDRKQYPASGYLSSRYEAKTSQNQLEIGDVTVRKNQTPRQLARTKSATKETTTISLRNEKKDSRIRKIRDKDEDDAVRNRVLQELGWALDEGKEEDEVVKAKVKKKRKKLQTAKLRKSTDAQSVRCSSSEVETPQATKTASESLGSEKPSRGRNRPRTIAVKKVSRSFAPAAVEATTQNTTIEDALEVTPDPEIEKHSDLVLLWLDLEQCRPHPSQEVGPEVFDNEVRRNSTPGDESDRHQLLNDLDSLLIVSRRTASFALDPDSLSFGNHDGLDVGPPDLQNEAFLSHIGSDTKKAEQELLSPQQLEDEESEVADMPSTASDSEVASDSSLDLRGEEDEHQQLEKLQSASADQTHESKNEGVLPDTAWDYPQSELSPLPLPAQSEDRVADGDSIAACEYEFEFEERNPADRTEIIAPADKAHDPNLVDAELSSSESMVTASPDLNLLIMDDHLVVLLGVDEQESVGGLELTLLGQQEDEKMVGEDSSFAQEMEFAVTELGHDDMVLQDRDCVCSELLPVVDGMDCLADSSTVDSVTIVFGDPVWYHGEKCIEKSNRVEDTREDGDDCHQQQRPDCGDEDQDTSLEPTARVEVNDQERASSGSRLLEGGANSQDAVLENESPQQLDQLEFTNQIIKAELVSDPRKDEEVASSEDDVDVLLGSISNVLRTAAGDEHATQATQSSVAIDGVCEDNKREAVRRKEEDNSAAVDTASVSVQGQDIRQCARDEFDSQAHQPSEIVDNIEKHGDAGCEEASAMAENSDEFHAICLDPAVDNEGASATDPKDNEAEASIELIASSPDTANSGWIAIAASESVHGLVGPPNIEADSDLGIAQSATTSDAIARGDTTENTLLLQATQTDSMSQDCGYELLCSEIEASGSSDPASWKDDTSAIDRDMDNKQGSQQGNGEDSSDGLHSPFTNALVATESATLSAKSDSHQHVGVHPSDNDDSSFGSPVVIELSEGAADKHVNLQGTSELANADGDRLVQCGPTKSSDLSQAFDADHSPARATATREGDAVAQAQETSKQEVAARRIQRQYRCFVQRQILADQLKFLMSQHHRQVRKKTRRASKKASVVVAFLSAVGDSSTDPLSLDGPIPPSASPSTASPFESEQQVEEPDVAADDAVEITVQADAVSNELHSQYNGVGEDQMNCESLSTPEVVLPSTGPQPAEESLNEAKVEGEGLTDNLGEEEAILALRANNTSGDPPVASTSFLTIDKPTQHAHQTGSNVEVGDDPATFESGQNPQAQEEFVPVDISSEPCVHSRSAGEHNKPSSEEEVQSFDAAEDSQPYEIAFALGDDVGDTLGLLPLVLAHATFTAAEAREVAESDRAEEVENGAVVNNQAILSSTASPTATSTTAMGQSVPQLSNAEQDAYLRSRATSITLAVLAFADDDDDDDTDFVASEERLMSESGELTSEAAYPAAATAVATHKSGLEELSSEEASGIHKWEQYLDAATNKSYYYNPITQVSQWTLPEDAAQVIDRTAADNGSTVETSAWGEQAELTASSFEEVDQAQQQQQQQQEAWHQAREQSLLLESTGGWSKFLMREAATIFFYHQERDEYFHNEDNSVPFEFSEAKTQFLHELHQSLADDPSEVGTAGNPIMMDTSVGYEVEFVPEVGQESANNVEQWGLRRNLSQSAEKRGKWQAFVDAESHQVFYYNAHTGESSWEVPAVFQDSSVAAATTGGQDANDYQWVEYIDDAFDAAYYVNLATGETTWEKPDDFDERTTMREELLHETSEGAVELQKLQRSRDDQVNIGNHEDRQMDEEEDDYVIRIDEHSAEQLDELF